MGEEILLYFQCSAGLGAGGVSIKFGNYVAMLDIHACRLENAETGMKGEEIGKLHTVEANSRSSYSGKVDFEIKMEFTVKMKNVASVDDIFRISFTRPPF